MYEVDACLRACMASSRIDVQCGTLCLFAKLEREASVQDGRAPVSYRAKCSHNPVDLSTYCSSCIIAKQDQAQGTLLLM